MFAWENLLGGCPTGRNWPVARVPLELATVLEDDSSRAASGNSLIDDPQRRAFLKLPRRPRYQLHFDAADPFRSVGAARSGRSELGASFLCCCLDKFHSHAAIPEAGIVSSPAVECGQFLAIRPDSILISRYGCPRRKADPTLRTLRGHARCPTGHPGNGPRAGHYKGYAEIVLVSGLATTASGGSDWSPLSSINHRMGMLALDFVVFGLRQRHVRLSRTHRLGPHEFFETRCRKDA